MRVHMAFGLRSVEDETDSLNFLATFWKSGDPDGRHKTYVRIVEVDGRGAYVKVFEDWAKLGWADLDRYDFFAGCRIALRRVLRAMGGYYSDDLTRALRRTVQIELSLVENRERQYVAMDEVRRLFAQRGGLLAAKAKNMDRKLCDVVKQDCREIGDDGLPSRIADLAKRDFPEVVRAECAECHGPEGPRKG